MNIYKKLIGNSVVFAFGNLGSKLISIILVPLYTYYLSTSEYGMVDIVTTTTTMLLPIISLNIYDAVLRFVMEDDQEKDAVFTNSLLITFIGCLCMLFIYFALNYFNLLNQLLKYMIIILILQAFQSLFAQFVRGVGKIKIYSLNGIVMTFVTASMNVILLVKFNMGLEGYFLSIIVGNLFSIIFLLISTKIYRYINLQKLNKNLIKKMTIYSIPLIPNAFMWWVMNASSRYFILFFLGSSENGLYAVANKIPSLLSILNTIFLQAWQMSAIEEYDSNDKSNFYSNVFEYFSMIMFISASGILLILKYVMRVAVASEFYTSWRYVPFLLLSIVFSSFSSFLGTNYIAAKKTNGVFRTSIIGGIVNIILNVIFVPLFKTNGAAISTMISFAVIWIIRIYDTRLFIDIRIDIMNLIKSLIIIFIQIIILYLDFYQSKEFIFEFLLFISLVLVNRDLFKKTKKLIHMRY